jgi:hypothetical protein
MTALATMQWGHRPLAGDGPMWGHLPLAGERSSAIE